MRTPTVALLAVLTWLLLPDVQEGSTPAPIEPLRALAPLVEHEWIAAFPTGELTDTQRFEWVYAGRFLRNVHEVRDSGGRVVYGGETIYAWDAREERLVWWYFNATGGFLSGTLEELGQGRYLAEGQNHGPPSQPAEVRSELRLEEDAWSSVSYERRDDAWREQRVLRFRPVE